MKVTNSEGEEEESPFIGFQYGTVSEFKRKSTDEKVTKVIIYYLRELQGVEFFTNTGSSHLIGRKVYSKKEISLLDD